MAGSEPSPIWLSWSSGKDSAYAFEVLRSDPRYRVVGLLTTVTATFDRVSMHGVREELLDRQASALGLPLHKVRIPFPCPNEAYEAAMGEALATARAEGVRQVAFGDLFLEDIRRYREEKLQPVGMTALFPLWGRPTTPLASAMIDAGIRATICCVDPRRLAATFAGRSFDHALLRELPPGVDPCGERGEFHTFVADAPSFRAPIPVRPGPVVERDGFVFADLVPAESAR
jgi:uncharacterized protein (TIGR00290 family)